VRRLASYRTFWLAHPPGRCTRVASPSTHTASPTSVISASRSLSEALAAYRTGTLVEPSKLTLGAFLDEWLPGMAGNLEPNTHEVYGHYARAYIKPKLGHVRLQQLTASNLRGFYSELAASGGRRGQGLKRKPSRTCMP
jgi:hypothetical protein